MAEPGTSSLFEAARRCERWAEEEINRLTRSFARHVTGGGGLPGAPELDWEDVAQEASRRFFSTGIQQFRAGGPERSYLYSIVKVTMIQLARGASRRRRREETIEAADVVPADDPTSRFDARRLLERLDSSCRQLLERVFLQSASHAELAKELGLAESSVRSRLSRCIRRARELE